MERTVSSQKSYKTHSKILYLQLTNSLKLLDSGSRKKLYSDLQFQFMKNLVDQEIFMVIGSKTEVPRLSLGILLAPEVLFSLLQVTTFMACPVLRHCLQCLLSFILHLYFLYFVLSKQFMTPFHLDYCASLAYLIFFFHFEQLPYKDLYICLFCNLLSLYACP